MKLKDDKGREIGVMELSRRAKISPAHVSKIISGARNPSLDTFAVIAGALKVSLDNLYLQLYYLQNPSERPVASRTMYGLQR